MARTTTVELAAELQTYFSKALLKQAKYRTVLDQFGHKENIPSNSSKTISFTQYSDLAPVSTTLTEGVTPTDQALATTAITATADQVGNYITLTDLAKLTVKHPVTQKATELLGVQAARSYDNLIAATLVAGTGVYYAGGVVSRATLTGTSYLTFQDVLKGVVNLRKQGATEFSDGNFVLVVDPQVEGDLLQDTDLKNVAYRQQPESHKNELYKGAIMTFGGVTIVRSNNLATYSAGSGGAVVGHVSYLFGQDAYAISDLQSLEMYVEQPGTNSDPLHQRMTMGWKFAFKSVITNNNWMARFESASRY